MNNAQTIEQSGPQDSDERLRTEEARLVRIIESLQIIQTTKEWSTLKKDIFDSFVSSLEKEIKSEARSENPNPLKLTRLSGKIEWAERYSDLSKLENYYKVQLTNLRTKLYDQRE